ESLDHWEWKPLLLRATEYYEKHLFTADGAPKNRDNQEFPYDIHGSAQGVITFSKVSRLNSDYLHLAEKILDWTIREFYSGDGYFYYQKTKYYTKRFSFMRWCNAWMLYALGEYLGAKNKLNRRNENDHAGQ
ncbi:MAG: hypothetical protein HQK58_10925, partial [Deltaproteobacteria bacterium]|nr:hypothetical protein [Deltaproteobacteria bacterium]